VLTTILVAGFLARLSLLFIFPSAFSLQTSGYDEYAVNLAEGGGYTRFPDRIGDSDLPPLYPFFLTGIYELLGRGPIQVGIVQAGLDIATMYLLFRLARRVAGTTAGLLATGFYAFYPYLAYQNITVNDTGLFILLLVAGIWLSYRTFDTRDWRYAAATGFVFGLGALTKPWVLLVLPVMVGWWLQGTNWRRVIGLAAAGGLSALVVLAPWMIRNTLLHGEPAFISTNGGSNLHQGNNLCVREYLARGWDAQWVDCLAQPPEGLSETALDRWHRQQALDYLRGNPRSWLPLLGTKLWVLWNPAIMPSGVPPEAASADDPVRLYSTSPFQLVRRIHFLYFGALVILGLVGAAVALRAHMEVLPLLAVLVCVTLTYVVFHPSTRYRSPADAFVFVFAAVGLLRLKTLAYDRSWTTGPAGT
jgi:4-amino-4-deoxy-L-arabinose transferase-like glycosyltransferase